ncbi:hypothetical protein Efla_001149 [Eimeria flavescens]
MRPPAAWPQQAPLGAAEAGPPSSRTRSPQQQQQQAALLLHPTSAAASVSSGSDKQPGEGRTLLRSLTFHRVLYVSEAYTSKRYNAGSNMLRKNYENFVLLKHKQALVTPGPKKAKDFPRGMVIAYPSGHIVAAATRQHFVGLGPQPDANMKNPPPPNPRDCFQVYADWIRRKFRSHETEPPCLTNGHTRFLNFLTRADLPQPPRFKEPLEVYLEELHDFIKLHFPHWIAVYDPEVAPLLAIRRLQKSATPEELAAAAAAAAAALAKVEGQQEQPPAAAAAAEWRRELGADPPAKRQRCSDEAAAAAAASPAAAAGAAAGTAVAAGRLILPASQQPKHLWPPPAKVEAYCRKECALAAAAAAAPGSPAAAAATAELQVTLLIGAAHIVAHCGSSPNLNATDCVADTNCCQAATSAAVSDIWSLLRYFVGPARDRFAAS